ncbi:MAG: hypothetical protein WA655_03885 [Candidatus Korobacteraceae bacterium]
MGDALSSLENQYIFLTNHLDEYLAACKTDAQKQVVIDNYVAARQNYWNCINKIFKDNDPQVSAAVKQMSTAQQDLKDSLAKLDQIAAVLNTIATAVKIGGELASLAG